MMVSEGEERWGVGFYFSSGSVDNGVAPWEMRTTLRPPAFMPFCLQDWEICAMCILGTRELKVCIVCLSPQNVYRQRTVHSESALHDVEHLCCNTLLTC